MRAFGSVTGAHPSTVMMTALTVGVTVGLFFVGGGTHLGNFNLEVSPASGWLPSTVMVSASTAVTVTRIGPCADCAWKAMPTSMVSMPWNASRGTCWISSGRLSP